MTGGRGLARLAAVVLLSGAAGCSIGEGDGAVSGQLFVIDCEGVGKDFGTPLSAGSDGGAEADAGSGPVRVGTAAYDMKPTFFVGEPIEDISGRQNRLLIRLQRNGRRIEVNDSLVFDVRNAYEVARCVRGCGNAPGVGAWDARYCDCPVQPGPARVKIGPDQAARASLVLLDTCKDRQVVAVAVAKTDTSGACAGQSWVDLKSFGSAAGSTAPVDRDFKLNWGERIQAMGYCLTLEDDRVVKAPGMGINPDDVDPEVGGELSGYFDFDLRRGRAAQAFP